ncbi:MAG: argininosuccinate synthase [Acidobacteriota bacterium]|nr:argininosuccinate synthase [Acidobacteriota bacterium]
MIEQTQETVSGEIRLKLYKGNVTILGRRSPNSLNKERVVTFEAAAVAAAAAIVYKKVEIGLLIETLRKDLATEFTADTKKN